VFSDTFGAKIAGCERRGGVLVGVGGTNDVTD